MGKKVFHRISLQLRVLLTTLITATLLLVVIENVTNWRTVTALENEIGGQVNAAGKQLAEKIGQQSYEEIPLQFKTMIQSVRKKVPSILRVDVYAKKRKKLELIASNVVKERVLEDFEKEALQSGKAKTYMTEPEPGRRRIVSVRPIQFQEGHTGIVTVICSFKPFRQLLTIHSRMRNTSLIVTIILLAVAITWMFQASIYRNIRHLVDAISRFRRGDTPARVREDLPGEFGDLAGQLNAMLDEISQFQVKLKGDVAEATQSLSARNIELSRLNLEMHKMQQQLTHAERLAVIGQLTATFAHEIGSPLSAVATHLQMLEEETKDPELRKRVQSSYEQVARVCGIVEKMLKRARRTGDMEPVDLRDILFKVSELVRPMLDMKQIVLALQLGEQSAQIIGDSDLLQQLFLNLFNNAVTAVRESGRIVIALAGLTREDSGYRITFEDNGVGIAKEKMDDIFEPFFTTKEIGKGTGLGLAVCREIVKRHGGTIDVESRPGATRFTIDLPIKRVMALEKVREEM